MKYIYLWLSILVISFSSCNDSEERYIGNWDASYIEINDIEPFFCSSSWVEIFKLDNGNMRVELHICDEDFFVTTNSYNNEIVEFDFVDQPAIDIEIFIEGTIEYIGDEEVQLDMIRDVYVDGQFVTGTDYFAVFE